MRLDNTEQQGGLIELETVEHHIIDVRTIRVAQLYCLLMLCILANFLYLLVSLVGRLGGLVYRLECPLLTVMSLTDLALSLCSRPPELYLAFSISLFFPLLNSVATIIHLVVSVVNNLRSEMKPGQVQDGSQAIRRVLVLLLLAAVISFFVCAAVASRLVFCRYSQSGDDLECLIETSDQAKFGNILTAGTLLLLLNPVHFPLTISAVIPLLFSLAFNPSIFIKTLHFKRSLSWFLFISIYSLFLSDLIIYSQSGTVLDNNILLLHPMHCRFPLGSLIRNVAVLSTTLALQIYNK